jgi:hypothetical protein
MLDLSNPTTITVVVIWATGISFAAFCYLLMHLSDVLMHISDNRTMCKVQRAKYEWLDRHPCSDEVAIAALTEIARPAPAPPARRRRTLRGWAVTRGAGPP